MKTRTSSKKRRREEQEDVQEEEVQEEPEEEAPSSDFPWLKQIKKLLKKVCTCRSIAIDLY